MGGKYSKVVNKFYPALKVLEGLTIAEIKNKVSSVSTVLNKTGIYFLRKSDIAWAFDQLTEIQLYEILLLFDYSQNGNVPSLDFWGALTLLSADSNEAKINYCFKLMDVNNKDYMNCNDLSIAILCACRGVSKIRGYQLMPNDFVEKMAIDAFRVCKKSLNENGNISINDVRMVLLSDELVRQYLAVLGVPLVEVDAAAMVTKRSNLLKEALSLQARIAESLSALEECEELLLEQRKNAGDEGGDAKLVRFTRVEVDNTVQALQLEMQAQQRRLLLESGGGNNLAIMTSSNGSDGSVAVGGPLSSLSLLSPDGRSRANGSKDTKLVGVIPPRPVELDENHPARRYLKPDNSLFADMDMTSDRKSDRSIYGEGFKLALLEIWSKLPQFQDNMVQLDVYTIIALFNNVGLSLSYQQALQCLQYMPKNAINRCHFNDLLKWFLLYGVDIMSSESSINSSIALGEDGSQSLGAWTAFVNLISKNMRDWNTFLKSNVTKVTTQSVILDKIDQLVPNRILKYSNFLHPERSVMAVTSASGKVTAARTANGKEMSFMMKLVEFRKLTSRKPSSIQLKYIFGHPTVKLLPPPPPNTGGADSSMEEKRADSRGRDHHRRGGGSRGGSRNRSGSRGKSQERHLHGGAADVPAGGGGGGHDKDASHGSGSGSVAGGGPYGIGTSPTKEKKEKHVGSSTGPYLSAAEHKPATKTIKMEDIDDWKLNFKLSVTCNPFNNLASKRPKESSRVRSVDKRHFIEDYSNLTAQDLLDYYNLMTEAKEMERYVTEEARVAAAAAVAAELASDPAAATALGSGAGGVPRPNVNARKQFKKTVKDMASVAWVAIQLKPTVTKEQERIFSAVVTNFFNSLPVHARKELYTDVFVQVFAVFKGDSKSGKAADKVASMFLNSLAGAGNAQAVADAEMAYFAAPKVLLVALFHDADHFVNLEKSLINADLFVSRALASATLEAQCIQSLSELVEDSRKYLHLGSKLFGPQEEELGEDNMNPLRFAKQVRGKRRAILEQVELAGKMTRPELVVICRELGLKDTGTLAELGKRVKEALEQQADNLGYGELSKFGEDMVAKLFHLFKLHPISRSEEDGGLSLWEFNQFLHRIGAPTLYDSAEYAALMQELQLLVDKEQRLRLRGLQAYYSGCGPKLAAESDAVGLGSLNEKLSGKFSFSSTFEPGALASLLTLVGSNSVFIPELLKTLTFLSTVKDVKMEAELDRLSEFFAMFDTKLGKSVNENVLMSRGWLARSIEDLSSWLSDGDKGIIPAMRAFLRQTFGKYDSWESILSVDLAQKINFERENDEEIKLWRFLALKQDVKLIKQRKRAKEKEIKQQFLETGVVSTELTAELAVIEELLATELINIAVYESMGFGASSDATGREGEDGVRSMTELSSELNSEDGRSEVGTGNGDSNNAEPAIIDYASKIEVKEDQILESVISAELPPPTKNSIDLPGFVLQLREDIIFLHNIRSQEDITLNFEESNAIFERKEILAKKIAEAHAIMKENENLIAAHSCAFYDAFRIFTIGISNVGFGTRDFCARSYLEGFDIAQYLPLGLGELAPARQQQLEREERANQRKASALAALEREKLRRNMTEEEKEKLRQELYAAQLKQWAREEADMFGEAYSALLDAREERKTTAEIAAMAKQWEALAVLKEKRYPEDLGTAVSQNNYGCVLLEFFGVSHPRGARTSNITLFVVMQKKC
jgi:Ca2+-binding EF-hand superfamily protein